MIASRLLPPHLLGQSLPAGPPADLVTLDSLGPLRSCPLEPTLVVFICDDSGSIAAPGGADPISDRYREIGLAVEAIARACTCGKELAAVLHFDTPAGDTGPFRLSVAELPSLLAGLTVPRDSYGISDLLPSLTRAAEIAAAHPGHQAVLMILSDLRLTDPEPAAVTGAIAAFPGEVYVGLLGSGEYAGLGSDIPLADVPGVNRVIQVGYEQSPGAVARAALEPLLCHRQIAGATGSGIRGRFHNAAAQVTAYLHSVRSVFGRAVRIGRHAE